MPVIPAGVGVIRSYGSQSFVDPSGGIGSTKLPNFPDTVTALEIDAIQVLIANASNAAEFRRDVIVGQAVDLSCAAGELVAFDETYSNVGIVAVMKFKRAPFSPFEYVEIPAPDASILTPERTSVLVTAGTGQAIVTGVMDALGEDACYTGSYLTTRKIKRLKVTPRPALLEPEAGQLPSGLPDVANTAGAQTTPA